MAGNIAVSQSTFPKVVYVHCAAHSLNVCVVAACEIQAVKNMMGTIVKICLFSNSPKHQLELENIQSIQSATASKLVNLYKTRWVARIHNLEVFFSLFPAVVRTLEVISEGGDTGWNQVSRRSADSLLICITKYQSLIAFVVTKQCLEYIKGLSVSLQES